MIFPGLFKFDGKFILLSSKSWYSNRYEILHMPWQLCCHGMCKILQRYDTLQWNYSKINLPSNLNYYGKIVCRMGPNTRRWYICSWHKLLNIKSNMIYFCKFHCYRRFYVSLPSKLHYLNHLISSQLLTMLAKRVLVFQQFNQLTTTVLRNDENANMYIFHVFPEKLCSPK